MLKRLTRLKAHLAELMEDPPHYAVLITRHKKSVLLRRFEFLPEIGFQYFAP